LSRGGGIRNWTSEEDFSATGSSGDPRRDVHSRAEDVITGPINDIRAG
jgi:hypothetical protein